MRGGGYELERRNDIANSGICGFGVCDREHNIGKRG